MVETREHTQAMGRICRKCAELAPEYVHPLLQTYVFDTLLTRTQVSRKVTFIRRDLPSFLSYIYNNFRELHFGVCVWELFGLK